MILKEIKTEGATVGQTIMPAVSPVSNISSQAPKPGYVSDVISSFTNLPAKREERATRMEVASKAGNLPGVASEVAGGVSDILGAAISPVTQIPILKEHPVIAAATIGAVSALASGGATVPSTVLSALKMGAFPVVQEQIMNWVNTPEYEQLRKDKPEFTSYLDLLGNIANGTFNAQLLRGSAQGINALAKKGPSVVKKVVGELPPGPDGGSGGGSGILGTGAKVLKTAKNIPTKISNTIEDFGTKIKQPDVTSGTAVSLNPKKALTESGQDVQVSVGGKLKKLSEVKPEEYTRMQLSTEKALTNFEKQAELYKNNRNPLNDPTEIVGQRVDNALNFADKKRQAVGKKMGEIEVKYTNKELPIGDDVTSSFVETIKSFDNPKYGVDTADAGIVRKLVDDFDKLEKGGATIGERLEFVRSWDRYLSDARDAFGNFKENATVNTRIQNAVRKLKDETVGAISSIDKVYKGLRTQYSMYKKLNEIGDALLGKEGMLGDKIKGGATVKRALKSNSDAGARQFLTKLKEITGYDAIKDGDLAITAMENVGDFQGLSLLEILREGKTGVVKRGLEKVQDVLVGDKKTRIKEYIKEDVPKSKLPNTQGGFMKIPDIRGLIEEAKKYKSAEEFVKGQPIVYHGSGTPLKQFSNKQGTFFTDDIMNAEGYAGGENVYEGYLNLKNPLIIDAKGALHRELDTKWGKTTQEIVGNVDKTKYDGVIFKNIKDSWIDDADVDTPSTIYYAFKPKDSFLNESQLTDIWNKANKK